MQRPAPPMSTRRRWCLVPDHVLGFGMLTCTLCLWVGSSVAVQTVFEGAAKYDKPAFVTLFNSAVSVSLLVPGLLTSSVTVASLRRVARLSATIGLLSLCSSLVFNMSLLHTSVATNTVLSSTSSVFTFVFSFFICRDEFRWRSFFSAVLSCLGVAIVALQAPANLSAGAVTNSNLGDVLALLAAAMFALASVLLRRCATAELDLSAYMGVTGLFAVSLTPALLYAADAGGWERFTPPTQDTLLALTLNAALGCSLANYLYNSALLLLTPLIANVCLSLSIPVSAVTDEVLLGQHRFSAEWAIGASIVTAGVVLAALDLEPAEDVDGVSWRKARLEAGEAAELHSLLGRGEAGDGGEEEDDDGEG